ncbi:glutathione peroxidase [Candidatus Brocadiaceae bacterium]|nr:glutathione peroxidase [Candidatus Brocadiaceae bacterium]
MLKFIRSLFLVIILTTVGFAQVEIDAAAPNFKLTDSKGTAHSLSDFAGKYVVLEWINFDCPFVKKHYNSKNMQNLQKQYTAKGVVWLQINSSAEGKQGNFSSEEINKRNAEHGSNATAYLIDADGTVGKLYGAKTTPHMYVINPKGTLIYAGAIDDKPSSKVEDIEGAVNYVANALDAAHAGKEVAVKTTAPYGCSVKY